MSKLMAREITVPSPGNNQKLGIRFYSASEGARENVWQREGAGTTGGDRRAEGPGEGARRASRGWTSPAARRSWIYATACPMAPERT